MGTAARTWVARWVGGGAAGVMRRRRDVLRCCSWPAALTDPVVCPHTRHPAALFHTRPPPPHPAPAAHTAGTAPQAAHLLVRLDVVDEVGQRVDALLHRERELGVVGAQEVGHLAGGHQVGGAWARGGGAGMGGGRGGGVAGRGLADEQGRGAAQARPLPGWRPAAAPKPAPAQHPSKQRLSSHSPPPPPPPATTPPPHKDPAATSQQHPPTHPRCRWSRCAACGRGQRRWWPP